MFKYYGKIIDNIENNNSNLGGNFMKLKFLILGFVCLFQLAIFSSVEAGLISEKQEIEMGAQTAQKLEAEYPVSKDQAINVEMDRIARKLLPYSERQGLQYTFKVLDDSMVNALAIPGGYVYTFQGLMDYMPEEHLRAAVIGHEIGHVAKKHSVHAMEKQLGIGLILSIAIGDKYNQIQNLFMKSVFASYSRKDEREADQKGFEYSTKAGYNPYSMMMSLNRLTDLPNQPKTNLFSEHPSSEARIDTLKKNMAEFGIRPMVQGEKKKEIHLVDGNWAWPKMTASNRQGYDPAYRAYAFAGKLSMLDRNGEFDPNKLKIRGNAIYHGETYLMEFTEEDASALRISHSAYLEQILKATKEWPRKQSK